MNHEEDLEKVNRAEVSLNAEAEDALEYQVWLARMLSIDEARTSDDDSPPYRA